jgi:hypothetical protein
VKSDTLVHKMIRKNEHSRIMVKSLEKRVFSIEEVCILGEIIHGKEQARIMGNCLRNEG